MRTDRKLWKLILLSLVTFGIYSLWFWSQYAKDMNYVCEGDGKHTRGIAFRIFISLITFGIYDFVWMYGAGERIFQNCAKRNIPTTTSGGKVLIWEILGSFIFIGPFVALHKLIEGLNQLCAYYNENRPTPAYMQSEQQTSPQIVINQYGTTPGASGDTTQIDTRNQSSRQPTKAPAPNAGARETAAAISGAMANAGKAAQSAQRFVQQKVDSLNLETEEHSGMKWLPILPIVSGICFLLGFFSNLRATHSLFPIIAALILALICYLKSSSIKAFSAIPFSIVAIELLQSSLWNLPYLRYMNFTAWLALITGVLTTAGAVLEWLLLFGNPSFRKQAVPIVLGAHTLMMIFYLILLFAEGTYQFDTLVTCLGFILFSSAYLLLLYRSRFSLLTSISDEENTNFSNVSTRQIAARSAVSPVPSHVSAYQQSYAPTSSWEVNPIYQQGKNVPRIEIEPQSPSHQQPVFNEPVPVAPSPTIDSMTACAACGFLSPVGTTTCPNCGATLRTRRRRSAAGSC